MSCRGGRPRRQMQRPAPRCAAAATRAARRRFSRPRRACPTPRWWPRPARSCRRPASSISFRPRAPSSPMPVRITPTAFGPTFWATERNITSTLGRCRFTCGPSAQAAEVARAVALDQQVLVAGRDVRVARQNLLAVLRFAHGHRRAAIHALGERRAESRGNVLRDDDRRRIRRHLVEHFADGFGAAGGCADGDDAIGRAQHRAARSTPAARRRCCDARLHRARMRPRRRARARRARRRRLLTLAISSSP